MSTLHTIHAMEELAAGDANHPAVIEFAEDVRARASMDAARAGRPGVGGVELLAALEELIRERIAYVPDPPTHDRVRSPAYLLTVLPEGDCDDQMTLAKAAAGQLGLRGRFVRLGFRTDRRDPYSHVVLLFQAEDVGAPGDVLLDSTIKPELLPAVLGMMTVSHVH